MAVFEVKSTHDVAREVLRLGEAQELAYDIQGRGACLNRDNGIAESGDRDGRIAQSVRQPFPGEIECKIYTCDEQIDIIRVADTKVHPQSLLECGCFQGGDIRDQHLRGFAFHQPEGTPGHGDKEKAFEGRGNGP